MFRAAGPSRVPRSQGAGRSRAATSHRCPRAPAPAGAAGASRPAPGRARGAARRGRSPGRGWGAPRSCSASGKLRCADSEKISKSFIEVKNSLDALGFWHEQHDNAACRSSARAAAAALRTGGTRHLSAPVLQHQPGQRGSAVLLRSEQLSCRQPQQRRGAQVRQQQLCGQAGYSF